MFDSSSSTFRKKVTPYLSGFLFTVGIFFFIDAIAYTRFLDSDDQPSIRVFFWIPALLALVAFMGLQMIDLSKLRGDGFGDDAKITRYGLFFVMLIAFSSIFIAVWILVEQYVPEGSDASIDSWPGFALILHVFLVLLSSFVLAAGKSQSDGF
ncbi:hypothetical protein P9112_005294 [Eukaryota sp. TZLM1-RC]